jgi:hypothetical protein
VTVVRGCGRQLARHRTSRYLLPVRIRRTAVLLVTAGVLVACSGDPGQPTTLPSLTPSPTPTATPTPRTNDLEAATNVVRRYFALLNSATTKGNADALSHLMTASCKCQEVVRATREVAARGQHYFGRIRVTSVIPTIDGDASADVLVHYDYTASGVADLHGRVIRSSPARTGVGVDFRLIQQNQTWVIAQILSVSAGRVQ